MKFDLTIDLIKKQATILKEFIDQSSGISRSAALQCVAKMYGFESWNHASAELKKGETQ
jgi:hypothetical protein